MDDFLDDDDVDLLHIFRAGDKIKPQNPKATILNNIAAGVLNHRQATAKLRDAYRKNCSNNHTAPSGYVLQHIDREHLQVSELQLSDSGAVSLSQSLSYHLMTIDLSSNGISDVGAEAFAASLEKSSLTSLDLSKNLIGDLGGVVLVNSLSKSKLSHLSLAGNKLGDMFAQSFEEIFLKNKVPALLTSKSDKPSPPPALNIRSSYQGSRRQTHIRSGSDEMTSFYREMSAKIDRDSVPSLESLDLSDNQIGVKGGKALARWLVGSTFRLCRINLGYNHLGDQGAAAIFLALNFPNCNRLEDVDVSFNGISDTGGSWIVSSLLTLFGAFELQQGWESDGQAAKEVFMSIHDAAKGCAANLPEFPSDVGSRTGCLCRVDLSRNRLGAKSAEGFARILSLPPIKPNRIETKNSLGDRMPSAYGFAESQGSARKTWGKSRSEKKSGLAKNPAGGGVTLSELKLGWNALGAEGTKK
eukprot:CAMPEP_0182514996 /NCGR_PEP_ID=MMETSP1321-20130603/37123_1 /TAXON_ID=91990 /ORGANISM="Bolidomonas sp., Strain RCC1657" /LENGTH=470 /DNA_ID=CAMNT_0024722333 /DNA_START=52 /DNA_END=1461 /DNA_ORIENTATION=+